MAEVVNFPVNRKMAQGKGGREINHNESIKIDQPKQESTKYVPSLRAAILILAWIILVYTGVWLIIEVLSWVLGGPSYMAFTAGRIPIVALSLLVIIKGRCFGQPHQRDMRTVILIFAWIVLFHNGLNIIIEVLSLISGVPRIPVYNTAWRVAAVALSLLVIIKGRSLGRQ